MSKPNIRAIFCDNEGCLTPGKGRGFPLDLISQVSSVLRKSPAPWFSLCTGRSISYTEAILQMLNISDSIFPCVCEGGAMLYWPKSDTYQATTFTESPNYLLLDHIQESLYRIEPGKMRCLSVYPERIATVEYLYERIKQSPLAERFNINMSIAAVDITPIGIDKLTGVELACKIMGVSLSEVLSIGDADNDVCVLEKIGYSACPSNGTKKVKETVDFIAPNESTRGVLDIFHHYGLG